MGNGFNGNSVSRIDTTSKLQSCKALSPSKNKASTIATLYNNWSIQGILVLLERESLQLEATDPTIVAATIAPASKSHKILRLFLL